MGAQFAASATQGGRQTASRVFVDIASRSETTGMGATVAFDRQGECAAALPIEFEYLAQAPAIGCSKQVNLGCSGRCLLHDRREQIVLKIEVRLDRCTAFG